MKALLAAAIALNMVAAACSRSSEQGALRRALPESSPQDSALTTAKPASAALVKPSSPPSSPLRFSLAKRALKKLYRHDPHATIYAACSFSEWQIDWTSCCYQARDKRRARLEWEHVVPAAAFGRSFDAWAFGHPDCVSRRGKKYRGRRCARKVDAEFRAMEGDMHNLYPAIGVLNEARSHFPPALIDGEPRRFGSCDFEVEDQRCEPPPAARGEVARAYLYMAATYPEHLSLDSVSRAMFAAWHLSDPPDAWEKSRNVGIAAIQGNHNGFIAAP